MSTKPSVFLTPGSVRAMPCGVAVAPVCWAATMMGNDSASVQPAAKRAREGRRMWNLQRGAGGLPNIRADLEKRSRSLALAKHRGEGCRVAARGRHHPGHSAVRTARLI